MNVTRLLGLAAVAGLLILAAPAERAEALSLANPGAAATVQQGSKVETTEVRLYHRGHRDHWHHRWHRHHHRHHR